jgi:hypothetical protein
MKDKLGPAQELRIYNPFKVKVGQGMSINSIDLRNKQFKVYSIRENNRFIGGVNYQSVDYDLLAVGEKTGNIRVRVTPMEHPDPASGLTHNVVVLSLYYSCGHQEGIESGLNSGVNAGTGEFEIDWNGKRKYFRINNLRGPCKIGVKVLQDLDGNGQIDSDEVRESTVEYWDYNTELLDEASQKYVELLFVERNTSDGWWQIWRGSEVDPDRVSIM